MTLILDDVFESTRLVKYKNNNNNRDTNPKVKTLKSSNPIRRKKNVYIALYLYPV